VGWSTSGRRREPGPSRRKGYLDGRRLAEVFAWLRPGDLVWNQLGEQQHRRHARAEVRHRVPEGTGRVDAARRQRRVPELRRRRVVYSGTPSAVAARGARETTEKALSDVTVEQKQSLSRQDAARFIAALAKGVGHDGRVTVQLGSRTLRFP